MNTYLLLVFDLPFIIFVAEDSSPITEPKRVEVMNTSPPQESIAILIRNQYDINTIQEMFGDVLLGIIPVTSRDPGSMRDLLRSQNKPVRSCFIFVESTKIMEEMLTSSKDYQELLKTANEIVGKNISS